MSKQRETHTGKQKIHGSTTREILSAYVIRSQELAEITLRELDACFESRHSLMPTDLPVVQDEYLLLLAKKFPMLDTSELKVCVLLRTYYSPSEIAGLLHISFSNVEELCARIALKLGVQPSGKLRDVIHQS